MLRIAREPGGEVRIGAAVQGRGAYVHANGECLKAIGRAGVLARALRTDVPPARVARLVEELRAAAWDGGSARDDGGLIEA